MTKQLQIDVPEYTTIVRREEATDGTYCYVAFHPELPNTMSQADTSEKAEKNLVEATELTLAHLKENNLSIPKPMSWEDAFYIYLQDEEGTPFEKSIISPYELTEEEIKQGEKWGWNKTMVEILENHSEAWEILANE